MMERMESLQKRQEVVARANRILENYARLCRSGLQGEAVLELGRAEDLLLRAVAEAYRLPLPEQQPGQEASLLEILQAVEKANLLEKADLDSLHELRRQRNTQAHYSAGSRGQRSGTRWQDALPVLQGRIPVLLCGLSAAPLEDQLGCVDQVVAQAEQAGQLAGGQQVPEAAALRLGQALEQLVRASAGIACPWALLADGRASTLQDQISGLQQTRCYTEGDIQQLHGIQGLRNRAAHQQNSPLDVQAVAAAARWLESFARGPFARLMGVEYDRAREARKRWQPVLWQVSSGQKLLNWMAAACFAVWLVSVCNQKDVSSMKGLPGVIQLVSSAGLMLYLILSGKNLLQANWILYGQKALPRCRESLEELFSSQIILALSLLFVRVLYWKDATVISASSPLLPVYALSLVLAVVAIPVILRRAASKMPGRIATPRDTNRSVRVPREQQDPCLTRQWWVLGTAVLALAATFLLPC